MTGHDTTTGPEGIAAPAGTVTVVIPTVGRASLQVLLDALSASAGPAPEQVLLVDDRTARTTPLPVAAPSDLPVKVLDGPQRGPAAARNVGWRAATTEWVAFLDDDVVPSARWLSELAHDLRGLPTRVAGSQGRIHVPVPRDRRPTDWERNVAALQTAQWATADLAYRRMALAAVGGFDERFPRAYREDADLGLRLVRDGWTIVTGARVITHPVRPADAWVSVRLQAGNADDPLMRALHGPRWREDAGVPRGRRRRHLATTTAGLVAAAAGGVRLLAARADRRPPHRSAATRVAVAGTAGWLAGTAELAWARIAPGPRSSREVARMLTTSAVLPAAATWHWLRGVAACRHVEARSTKQQRPAAVLVDRDGTLVVDEPYNGDPERVVAMPGARAALQRLRAAGIPLAVVSNQSGIGRGLLSAEEVDAVNRRVDALLGPFDHWAVCPHAPTAGCACRKPAPGLVLDAAAVLGVDPADCALIGDIGADVDAARAAGARGVLVPTPRTRIDEVEAATQVAPDLAAAVDRLLGEEVGRS